MGLARLTRTASRVSEPPIGPATPAAHQPALASLLTPAEAAKRLGVGQRLLERWRSTGGGPCFVKMTGKTVRYRSEDLEAFISGNVRKNTAG